MAEPLRQTVFREIQRNAPLLKQERPRNECSAALVTQQDRGVTRPRAHNYARGLDGNRNGRPCAGTAVNVQRSERSLSAEPVRGVSVRRVVFGPIS